MDDRVKLFRNIMVNEDGKQIVSDDMVDSLIEKGFFTAPASTKYHGNYEGGLYDHSKNVTESLLNLTDALGLKWKRPESPKIIGMFHDLCKIDTYRHPFPFDDPKAWEYNTETTLKGHGDKSVMFLSQFITLTEEEILCIRYHMGAFTDKEEWSDFTRAIHLYPNVLFTHTADMMAAHILEV